MNNCQKFEPKQLVKDVCASCNELLSKHKDECESCGALSMECKMHEPTKMFLCWTCYDKNLQALLNKIDTSQAEHKVFNVVNEQIRYNGDFYNAKTQAIVDLKLAIENDDSIEDKQFAFQNALVERHKHLQSVIFEVDKQKYEATLEQLAIGRTLREFGDSLRKEIREELRKNDNTYSPPVQKILTKPKMAKKITPIERIIENLAATSNISKEQARAMIKAGMKASKEKNEEQ